MHLIRTSSAPPLCLLTCKNTELSCARVSGWLYMHFTYNTLHETLTENKEKEKKEHKEINPAPDYVYMF